MGTIESKDTLLADSYDLSNPEELLQFDIDCIAACCESPQYRVWDIIDVEVGRCSVSPEEVFLFWRGSNTLFSSGYCKCLTYEAKATFNRYTEHMLFEDGYEGLEDPDMKVVVIDIVKGEVLTDKEITFKTVGEY